MGKPKVLSKADLQCMQPTNVAITILLHGPELQPVWRSVWKEVFRHLNGSDVTVPSCRKG